MCSLAARSEHTPAVLRHRRSSQQSRATSRDASTASLLSTVPGHPPSLPVSALLLPFSGWFLPQNQCSSFSVFWRLRRRQGLLLSPPKGPRAKQLPAHHREVFGARTQRTAVCQGWGLLLMQGHPRGVKQDTSGQHPSQATSSHSRKRNPYLCQSLSLLSVYFSLPELTSPTRFGFSWNSCLESQRLFASSPSLAAGWEQGKDKAVRGGDWEQWILCRTLPIPGGHSDQG